MSSHNHALFQITVKVLLRNEGRILTLLTDDGYVDFPGGRIDESEIALPFKTALEREIREELGSNIQLNINNISLVSKRQYNLDGKDHHVVAIYFDAAYLRGDIILSDEHERLQWLTPKELLQHDKFVSQDEYDQLKKYLTA